MSKVQEQSRIKERDEWWKFLESVEILGMGRWGLVIYMEGIVTNNN